MVSPLNCLPVKIIFQSQIQRFQAEGLLLRLKNMMPLSPKIKALRVNDNVLYFSKYHSHIRVGYSNFFRIICLKSVDFIRKL